MTRTPALRSQVVERPGTPTRLLVLLHGYGEPVADLVDRLDRIDPEGRFLAVAPDAPFERRGRSIWHRAAHAGSEATEQYLASLRAIDAHLGQLAAAHGMPAAEAVVGGFSQGGGLALGLLLAADVSNRPAAAFGVCSFPPPIPGFAVDRTAVAGRRYFLSSAHRDHFAPIEASRQGAAVLRDLGVDLTYVEDDAEHVMTDLAADRVGAWLAALDAAAPGEQAAAPPAEVLAAVDSSGSYAWQLWDIR